MRKVFLTVRVIALIICIVSPLYPGTITLLHSNDTHGTYRPYKIRKDGIERLVGGMEAVSHYLNGIRAREKNVLVIDTGDILTGTLAATIEYQGVIGGVMVDFFNRLGYDIWGFGNHEFDKGQKNTQGLIKLAKFPTVMSNVVYEQDNKLFSPEPYHIMVRDGLKVGIIAAMEENFLTEVHKDRIEGLNVLPLISTLNSYVPLLDKQTDLIVVIAHSSFNDGVRIAKNVPGIDVVLVAAEDGKFQDVNGVLVKSTFGHQKTLGFLKLEVKKDRIADYEEKLIWLWADMELSPSQSITSLVKEVDELVGTEYRKIIGEVKIDLTLQKYPNEMAQVESSLGNWITDVMRWQTGAQIGLHNSGAIRADILAGPICMEEIFEVCPFRNTLLVFKLSGQQLKQAFEMDVERNQDRLQISGMKYRYYAKAAKPFGQRVAYLEVNGDVLVKDGNVLLPEKTYTVVSNDYLVGHAEQKYFGFPVSFPQVKELPLNQALKEWLDKFKVLEYRVEGRIKEINRDH